MIVVSLMGGLGNQLFQYATALSLAEANCTTVAVDKSYFDSDISHGGCRLANLNFNNLVYTEIGLLDSLIKKILIKLPFLARFSSKFYHENNKPKLMHDKVIMLGYWQSYKNFDSIYSKLKKSIKPKNVSEKAKIIRGEVFDNSVSIHIRRGDYLNKKTIENHGVCSEEYYRKAILKIKNDIENPVFFVFSNDFEWVHKNILHLFFDKRFFIVDGNNQEEDLWLMSLCSHNIIANSSFSWWGAYLAKNDNQIVIAPTPWYEKKQRSSVDPCLPNWHRLEK